MLLAGPCARRDRGRRNSKHTGSCLGRGAWGTGSVHTGARHGAKVPAVQGEAPARINQEVPSWTRSLEKLPGHPGTPLHLSPTIRETVPHSLCSARVIAAAWGPPHLGLTQNSNWDQASGGGWQGQLCVIWFIRKINADRLFYKLFFFYFIYLVLVVLGLCYCTGFSLVEASEGSPLAALCRRLIVLASLVEHRL